jgi:hypothetical protein
MTGRRGAGQPWWAEALGDAVRAHGIATEDARPLSDGYHATVTLPRAGLTARVARPGEGPQAIQAELDFAVLAAGHGLPVLAPASPRARPRDLASLPEGPAGTGRLRLRRRRLQRSRPGEEPRRRPPARSWHPDPQRAAALSALPGRAGFALMSQRWRTLQRVMLSPRQDRRHRPGCPGPRPVRAQDDHMKSLRKPHWPAPGSETRV